MRPRTIWISAIGLFAAGVLATKVLSVPAGCEFRSLSQVKSPEQEYEATAIFQVCPGGFTSVVADRVQVARILTGEPPVDVVIVSWPKLDSDDPILSWFDNKTLVVEVANRAEIYRYVAVENGAQIELKRRPPAKD